jgi:tetratricopeptide (TPR) repeat protein
MKKFISTLFCLFAICNLHAQFLNKYQAAIDSMEKKNVRNQEIPYFKKELSKSPNNPEVLRILGMLYGSENNLTEAEKYYQLAIKANPKCADCYLNLGKIDAGNKQYSSAIEKVSKAIAIAPKQSDYYMVRGNLHRLNNNNDNAKADFDQCIKLQPKNIDYLMQRALFNKATDRINAAVTDMNKAIQLSPKNGILFYEKASLFAEKNMNADALKAADDGLKADPKSISLLELRGKLFSQQKDYDKAVMDFDKESTLAPNNYYPIYLKAVTNFYQNNIDGYCSNLNKCKNIIKPSKESEPALNEINSRIGACCDASKSGYYYQRGVAFYNLKKYDEAIAMYTTGINKFPTSAILMLSRGNAKLSNALFAEAIKDFEASLANKNDIIESNMADTSDEQTKGKLEYKNSLIVINHASIAECYFALNQYDKALEAIDQALALTTESMAPIKHQYASLRGNILLGLHRYTDAKNEFTDYLDHQPTASNECVYLCIAKLGEMGYMDLQNKLYKETKGANEQVKWQLPKALTVPTQEGILSAYKDCKSAITYDAKSAIAHYWMGMMAKLANVEYCADFLKAQELGMPLEIEIKNTCK